jgi:competence protein ComEA
VIIIYISYGWGILFLIKRKETGKEEKMIRRTILFVFALLLFVNSAFAAVNINKADQAALEALPGIGAAKATAIIEYRTKNGNFKTKEQLLEVKGIGPKILESLQKEIEI